MKKKNIELYVGLFVLVGFFCIGYLVLVIGQFSIFPGDQYAVHGYFSSASGLKAGARVEMAGVEIGNVSEISIDTKVSFRRNVIV